MFVQTFVLCAVLICGAFAVKEPTEDEKKIMEKCQQETKAPQSAVDKFHNIEVPEDSKESKCYISCVMKTFGALKEDGTSDDDNVHGYMKETYGDKADKALQIWKTCVDEVDKGDDECAWAYDIVKCFVEEGEKENLNKSK